jgi:hypothetical protein
MSDRTRVTRFNTTVEFLYDDRCPRAYDAHVSGQCPGLDEPEV